MSSPGAKFVSVAKSRGVSPQTPASTELTTFPAAEPPNIDGAGLPLNRFLVELDVPDDVWAAREAIDVTALPPTWLAIPAGQASVRVGSQCLASLRSPILLVPSVIVPEGARCPGESQASGVRAHHGPGGAPVRVQPAFPVVA
jgi:hypothetical protein